MTGSLTDYGRGLTSLEWPNLNAEVRSDTRLETILDALDAAVMTITPRFVVLTWNRGAERLFGFSKAEAVGVSLFDIFSPGKYEDGWTAESAFDHVMKHDLWRGEAIFERRDGRPFLADVTYGVLRDESEEPTGLFGIFRNITGSRELETTIDELGG